MSTYRIWIQLSRGQPFAGDFAAENSDHAIRCAIEALRAQGIVHGVKRLEIVSVKRQRGEA